MVLGVMYEAAEAERAAKEMLKKENTELKTRITTLDNMLSEVCFNDTKARLENSELKRKNNALMKVYEAAKQVDDIRGGGAYDFYVNIHAVLAEAQKVIGEK